MKNKFLILCDTHPEHYYRKERIPAICKALEDIGASFNIIDIYGFINDDDAVKIHSLSVKRQEEYFNKTDLCQLNKNLLKRVLTYECNIVIFFTMANYSLYLLPSTLEELRREKFVVGVFGDDEFVFHHNKFWLPLFDATVTYTKKEAEIYNDMHNNMHLLPVGYLDEELNEFSNDQNKDIDVLFIGRPYGSRPQIIKALLDHGINVDIYGSNEWEKYNLGKAYKGFVSNEDYNNLVSRTKIYLSLMEDKYTGKPHINGKVFDALKTKTFVITTYYEPFISMYGLMPDENIVMYSSLEDLLKKINYYLVHIDERKKLVNAMCQIIVPHFEYINLYKNLFYQLIQRSYQKFQVKNINENIAIIQKNNNHIQVSFSHRTLSYKEKFFRQNMNSLIPEYLIYKTNQGNIDFDFLANYCIFLKKNFPNCSFKFLNLINGKKVNFSQYIGHMDSIVWKKSDFINMYKKQYRFEWILGKGKFVIVPVILNNYKKSTIMNILNQFINKIRLIKNFIGEINGK